MTRLFIVRHGNTFEAEEPPRRIGRRTDLPLVASGREQAVALGDHFACHAVKFARAFAGPLMRTRETAAIILARLNDRLVVETHEWLAEIDHGPDENQPEAAVAMRVGKGMLDRWEREAVPPPDWRVDAADRLRGWRSMLDAPPTGDTLLVTSSGAARFALVALAGHDGKALKLRTGAFGLLTRDDRDAASDGCWRVATWDELPST